MRYPKDVLVWEYSPDAKLGQVVVLMRNTRGVMAKTAGAIADMGVNVLSGFVTVPSSQGFGTWSFFADFSHADVSPGEFKRRLSGTDGVESVDLTMAKDGFMVDKQHFPVRWAGRRVLILRTDAVMEMVSSLWRVFGTGAATIIDQMAEAMGRYSAREVTQDFGREFLLEEFEEVLGAYTALGYADLTIERSRPPDGPIVVHARDLFECSSNAKAGTRRRSIFFRGHLRGFVSAVYGGDYQVTEVQCVAEGDEVCSFQIVRDARSTSMIPVKTEGKNP